MVWAHSNLLEDGKGKGLKADDIFGCYACAYCHDVLDGRQRLPERDRAYGLDARFHRAVKESWRRLWKKGVIGEK